MSIGFIGLGNMGSPMARNLIARGIRLTVFDLDADKLAEFHKRGADICSSPAHLASKCNQIVTMLPNSANILSVYEQTEGIIDGLHADTLCIDCSTIDHSVAIQVSEMVSTKCSNFIDAPVSGGVMGAQDATLTFMIGGDRRAFDRATPLLKLMGKNTVYCGKVGSGQVTKLCNNLLLASQMAALAETMNLGMKLGLDPKILASVINSSSGRCWSSDTYNPVPDVIPGTPSCADYSPGFSCTLMAKDLGLAQNLSTRHKIPIPMGSMAHNLYLFLSKEKRFRSKDFSIIYKFISDCE